MYYSLCFKLMQLKLGSVKIPSVLYLHLPTVYTVPEVHTGPENYSGTKYTYRSDVVLIAALLVTLGAPLSLTSRLISIE